MNTQRHEPLVISASFAGATITIALARKLVDDFLQRRSAPKDLRERAALAVSELASNAVQASPGEDYQVTVEEITDAPEFVIGVTNSTSAEAIPPREDWGPQDVLAPRGRGLAIVESVSDSVQIENIEGGLVSVNARLSPS